MFSFIEFIDFLNTDLVSRFSILKQFQAQLDRQIEKSKNQIEQILQTSKDTFIDASMHLKLKLKNVIAVNYFL